MSKGARLRRPASRVRRALRQTPPAYFDLVEYLMDRGYAGTKKEAREIILAKRVTADSHSLGVGQEPVIGPGGGIEMVDAVFPHVPVLLKPRVIVSEAKEDKE